MLVFVFNGGVKPIDTYAACVFVRFSEVSVFGLLLRLWHQGKLESIETES